MFCPDNSINKVLRGKLGFSRGRADFRKICRPFFKSTTTFFKSTKDFLEGGGGGGGLFSRGGTGWSSKIASHKLTPKWGTLRLVRA